MNLLGLWTVCTVLLFCTNDFKATVVMFADISEDSSVLVVENCFIVRKNTKKRTGNITRPNAQG